MRRSVNIMLVFVSLFQAAAFTFNAHSIVIGGDCRPVRLVALFTTGLMTAMMVALVRWRIHDAR